MMGSSDAHRNRGGAVKSAAQVLVDDAAGAGVHRPTWCTLLRTRNSEGARNENREYGSTEPCLHLLLLGTALGCSQPGSEEASDEVRTTSSGTAEANGAFRYALPPNNPFLIQNSVYPSVHFNSAQTDVTTLPVWHGNGKIEPSQVDWLPGLTTIGTVHRPYSGGEHAVFFSGGNRVGKIRITGGDFSMVDEVPIPGFEANTISTTQLRRIVKQMESANRDEKEYLPPLTEFLEMTAQSSATLMNGLYTLMDSDGYYYAGWGTSVYKVADVREGDVYSPIEIVKSYDLRSGLPEDQRDKISRILGFAMTYDGNLAIAMPGIIAVMDRDFGGMQYILLEGEAVDNSISVDDRGGIYLVTSKYMRRLSGTARSSRMTRPTARGRASMILCPIRKRCPVARATPRRSWALDPMTTNSSSLQMPENR